MKGLSLAIIGSVVLALVGVTVMVALFTDISPIDTESGFCSVYNGISPSLPDALTPSVAGCKKGSGIEYRKISTTKSDRFALKLATGVMECWNKYKGYDIDFKRCKAWNVPALNSPVNESFVNKKMTENSLCPELIENSVLEHSGSSTCGSSNNIVFRPENIGGSTGSFIVIGINGSTGSQFVEVK